MRVEFEITRDEYVEASHVATRRRQDWFRPLRLTALAGAAAGVALLIGSDRWSWPAPVLLTLLGLFTSTYPSLRYRSDLAEGWKDYEQRAQPITWEFDEQNIRFESPFRRSEYSWYAFTSFVESRRLMLIYLGSQQFITIPKRAFAGPQQVEEFRQLLHHALPKPTSGFPVKPRGHD